MSKVRVVLAGHSPAIASTVEEVFKPDVEVVHFISDKSIAGDEIARLLSGQQPSQPTAAGVGTGDYSSPPTAVVLGMVFHDALLEDVRRPSQGAGNGVPWLVPGVTESEVKDLIAKPAPENAGAKSAETTKAKLLEVFANGKGGADGVHYWKRS